MRSKSPKPAFVDAPGGGEHEHRLRSVVSRLADNRRQPSSFRGPVLGGLTRLDARAAFFDEARHFTPWLASNLSVLGEAIGLDLQLVETEVGVGEFSVDIVAKDLSSGSHVIIENQLERTDHGHLGQLLKGLDPPQQRDSAA